MALIHLSVYSEVLELTTSIVVILPDPNYRKEKHQVAKVRRENYPVLYLLHGLSDDCTTWLRQTSIERYVENLNIAVVMPMVDRSYYTDMTSGLKYWTYFSEELPFILNKFFPLSQKREHTFAVGLSMGGYGAFKLALTHPDRIAAAASLSGVLDVVNIVIRGQLTDNPDDLCESERIFGDVNQLEGSQNDLFYLSRLLSEYPNPKPIFFSCCGTEDDPGLYQDNIRFKDMALQYGLNLTYEEGPGGHEWAYWDRQIQKVLQWLPIPKEME